MIGNLVELVWVSLAATVFLSVAGSVCVLGVTRAGELRRAGHGAAATWYAALGLAGALAIAAGLVGGLVVIVTG